MKKTSYFRNIAILIFAFTALSCSNLFEQEANHNSKKNDMAFITLSLGPDKGARTVLPEISENSFTNLVLKGSKNGEEEKTFGEWESVSSMKEEVLPLSTGNWNFTLTAKQGETNFIGSLSKEITVGANSLAFELSICDFGTGKGSFSIKLDFTDAANADKITKAIATLENSDGSAVTDFSSKTLTPSENAVVFAASNIASGIYRAKVIFYATNGGVDFEVATWRELVQISSSLVSNANHTIESFDNLYTITYNLNDGVLAEGVTLPETVTRKTSAITLPELSRDYYTFNGWYTDENYSTANKITEITNVNSDITIYAKFTPKYWVVTYYLNGGTNAENAVIRYTIEDEVILLDPINGENAFGGWFLTNNFTGNKVTGWSKGEKHENISLYAKWDGILVTAENISAKIKSLTESATLKARGEFSDSTITEINIALKDLLNRYNKNVLVSLDLSEVTGLTQLKPSAAKSTNSFSGCGNLANVILPDTLELIGSYAFYDCLSITNIVVPDSVTTIQASAFNHCLPKEITLPFVGTQLNATTASENTLFGIIFGTDKSGYTQKQYYSSSQYKETNVYSTIEKVTVKGGQLFYGAFSNCQDIKTIIICDSVTKIGDNCFSGCGGLESITLPYIGRDLDTPSVFGYLFGKNSYWQGVSTTQNSVYYIPKYLHSVTITGGKIIGGAFYNCTSITDVRIESNVYYIGSQAFVGCSALKRIYLKKTYSTKPSRYTISGDSGRQPEYTANRLKSGDYSEYAYEISN